MDPYSQPTLDAQSLAQPSLEGGEGPCMRCGATPARTNSYMWVTSFLVVTRHLEYQARLCRACATRTGLTELGKSALLGWWGIPWGLLTVGAVVKNVRSLLRWSTIPRPAVLLLALLPLAVPAALGAWFYLEERETAAAKRTGDWASEEVVRQVERGHELADAGKLEEALAAYRKAYEGAPGSSVVSFSLATTYVALGDLDAALPFAARAAELAPQDAGSAALHGWLLLQRGDEAAAREKAKVALAQEPEVPVDAGWTVDLLLGLQDWEAADRAAAAAAARFPEDPYFPTARLFALLGKDDLTGYEAHRATLSVGDPLRSDVAVADLIHDVRTAPEEALAGVLERWSAGELGEATMRQIALAASRAGYLETARERIRAWAFAAATPGEVWWLMHVWLPEDELAAALDELLAARPEPVPALVRFSGLDPLRDGARRLALARRVREADHPLAGLLDGVYVTESRRALEPAAWRREMEDHLARHPDHAYCRLAVATSLLERDPAAAVAQLEPIAPGDDARLAAMLAHAVAEAHLAAGDADAAAEALTAAEAQEAKDPALAVRGQLLRMELALLRGKARAALLSRSNDAARIEDLEVRAAALVLRWTAELAAGMPLTYRRDVDDWMAAADVEALRSSSSRATQALLLLEGRTDAATAALATGPGPSPTLAWVTLLEATAETGTLDEAALAAVADSTPRYAWAARLARLARPPAAG